MSTASGGPVGEHLPGPEGGAPDGTEAENGDADPQGDPRAQPPEDGDEVVAVIDELAVVTGERDDYLDALRRVQADFENYKKRVAKQQAEYADRAAGTLVEVLLPVLDTADLAMSHGGGQDLIQVRSALLDALGKEGLERVDPAGESFDPNVHDAVAHEPGDGSTDGPQEVAEVLRAGYRWKSRVLRPAMVKVRG